MLLHRSRVGAGLHRRVFQVNRTWFQGRTHDCGGGLLRTGSATESELGSYRAQCVTRKLSCLRAWTGDKH